MEIGDAMIALVNTHQGGAVGGSVSGIELQVIPSWGEYFGDAAINTTHNLGSAASVIAEPEFDLFMS